MKRRSAIEPVIGHLKNEHRMDRNYLGGRHGDANNAAVGYNFRPLTRWLRLLFILVLVAISPAPKSVAA
jgi:IS5 family transposase